MEQKQKLEPKSIYDYTKILEEIPDYDEVRGIFLACQIDDINRIDDTMIRSLNAAKKFLDLSHIPATYFTLNKEEKYLNLVAEEVSFPESVYQKDGKSYRKNRKMYLKKQGLLS